MTYPQIWLPVAIFLAVTVTCEIKPVRSDPYLVAADLQPEPHAMAPRATDEGPTESEAPSMEAVTPEGRGGTEAWSAPGPRLPTIGPPVRPHGPITAAWESEPGAKEQLASGEACAWRAHNDRIVIDLTALPAVSHWTQTAAGYTWRAGSLTASADAAGMGEVHLTILPENSGLYYMTAVSSAVSLAQTRSSSFWLRFTGGLQLYDLRGRLLMRYHGSGGRDFRIVSMRLRDEGHVDCSPVVDGVTGLFALVTYPLVAREFYQVVVAGRSALMALTKLVLVRCEGSSCDPASEHIRGALSHLNESACLQQFDTLAW